MKYLSVVSIVLFSLFINTSCSKDSGDSSTTSSNHYDGPIIDMHVHTGEIMDAIATVLQGQGGAGGGHNHGGGSGGGPSMGERLTFEEHRKQTYEMFEKYNIVKAMVSGIDFRASEWAEQDPDRIIAGSMILDADFPSAEEVRQAHTEGKLQAIGEVGFYYQGMWATDSAVTPYFDLAVELGLPIGYHLMANLDSTNANPLQFKDVLASHPNMKIYIMHAGFPYLDEMKTLLSKHPQVYVDISAISDNDGFEDYVKALMDMGYGKRIMYGTDQMEDPSIFDKAVPAVNNLSFLTYEQKADIFYYNAARFLELSDEEIEMHWNN